MYLTEPLAPHTNAILKRVRDQTGSMHWCGTTATAVCCTGHEFYDEPALVALISDIPPEQYRIIRDEDDAVSGEDFRAWTRDHSACFGVVHCDPYDHRMPQLIRDFARDLNDGFIVGGLMSAQEGSPRIAGNVSHDPVSGVVFAGNVEVSTGLTQACTPLSPIHEISGCQGNIIITLDGRPALDVLKADIGDLLARDLRKLGGYVFAGLPVTGSDTGDYLVRNLVGIDPEQKLIAIGDTVTAGQTLMFCKRDANSAHDDLVRMLNETRSRLSHAPRGGLYFSCVARGRHMFGPDSAEMNVLQEVLGDLPIAGFFANGEISHHRLYGYTGVLTLF